MKTVVTFTVDHRKYHEDKVIDDIIRFVRKTELDSDAISNLQKIIQNEFVSLEYFGKWVVFIFIISIMLGMNVVIRLG